MCDISEKIKTLKLTKIAKDVASSSLKTIISIEEIKNAECIVCFNDNNDCNLGITNCGHYICSDCYTNILVNFKKCPVCQKELRGENYDIIYI
jgi:hypothetical protein